MQRFFEHFIEKVKNPEIDGIQILQDPMNIPQNVDMEKSGTAYKIHIKAFDMKVHGLGNLSIKYLKAIRRYGLKDLRLNITLESELTLNGKYQLNVKIQLFNPIWHNA